MKNEANIILLLFPTLALAAANQYFASVLKIALVLRWILLGVMCFFYIWHKQFRKADSVDIFFVLFILESFLSRYYSIKPDITFQKSLLLLAMYLVVFFEIRRFISFRNGLTRFYGVLIRYSKSIISVTILSIPFIGVMHGSGGRFYGIFANPNTLGAFCVVAVPTLFASLIESKTKKKKNNNFLFLVAALVVLFLSGSRSGMLCTFFSLGFYIAAVVKNKAAYILGALFLLITLLTASVLMGTESISETVESKLRLETLTELGGRSEAWEVAKECIREKPLFGHGYGTEGDIFNYYDIVFKVHYGKYIHNSYLSIISTNGYLGLLLMMPVLGSIVLSCIRLFKRRNKLGSIKPVAMLFVGIVIGLFLHAAAESWMFSIGSLISIIFWSLAATILTLANFSRKGDALYA